MDIRETDGQLASPRVVVPSDGAYGAVLSVMGQLSMDGLVREKEGRRVVALAALVAPGEGEAREQMQREPHVATVVAGAGSLCGGMCAPPVITDRGEARRAALRPLLLSLVSVFFLFFARSFSPVFFLSFLLLVSSCHIPSQHPLFAVQNAAAGPAVTAINKKMNVQIVCSLHFGRHQSSM